MTNSHDEFIAILRERNPILNTIQHWITRGQYTHAKPHPECYLKAIEAYAREDDPVIGFEDSPRGMKALMQTRAKPIMVSEIPYPEMATFVQEGVIHFPSLDKIEGSQL